MAPPCFKVLVLVLLGRLLGHVSLPFWESWTAAGALVGCPSMSMAQSKCREEPGCVESGGWPLW